MTSRLVPGRTPQPGLSPVADAIRARRGERGLTPLDSVLLHAPAIAEGWNTLLGAVRARGKLPGDIRELMILRVAAVNRAAYEWIHHEPVGRTHGLTTAQLYVVRDVSTPLPPANGILSSLQSSALRFVDSSTRDVQVPNQITLDLMRDLGDLVKLTHAKDQGEEEEIQDLFVEVAAVVGTYNMVSRFLVSTDVAGLSDSEVPWPVERKEHFVPIPSESDSTTHAHKIHAITLTTSPTAPWIVFANSLLTDLTMWSYIIPYFLQNSFNVLLHSQRGHGQSTLPPPPPSPSYMQTTIPSLAYDIAHLLHSLHIPTPVHAIIGVSQGGAAALAFSALPDFFPTTSLPSPLPITKSIIACDTAARTPAGNREAWEERAGLVFGAKISFDPHSPSFPSALPLDDECANKLGMSRLATVTVPRWFPSGSTLSSASNAYHPERTSWISSLITHTPPRGFLAGAQALADYDLLSDSDARAGILRPPHNTLLGVQKVLLLAGALDGAGKVGKGLKDLAERWENVRGNVTYAELPESGHLPMIDQPERWWSVVSDFL